MKFLKRFYEIPLTNKKVMARNVKFCYCVSAPVPVRVSEHESSLASKVEQLWSFLQCTFFGGKELSLNCTMYDGELIAAAVVEGTSSVLPTIKKSK